MIRRLEGKIRGMLSPRGRNSRRAPGAGQGRGECAVIKGRMKNVIVVKPEGGIFQEAVFILREDALNTPGVSQRELFRQACAAAEEYTRNNLPRGGGRGRAALIPAALCLLAVAIWAALRLLGG